MKGGAIDKGSGKGREERVSLWKFLSFDMVGSYGTNERASVRAKMCKEKGCLGKIIFRSVKRKGVLSISFGVSGLRDNMVPS